jgi:hypothetical protein
MTDDMEKQLAEMDRIEKLKGGRNPTRAQQYFTPAPLTEEQLQAMAAEQERVERLKKPPVLPPRQEPDFIQQKREQMQRDQRKEQLINATGSRIA